MLVHWSSTVFTPAGRRLRTITPRELSLGMEARWPVAGARRLSTLSYPASTVGEMASGGESELLDVAVGSGFTWLRRQDLQGENGWCFRAKFCTIRLLLVH
jgi:hypothetical protein